MKPQYSKWQTQRRCLPDKEWAVATYHRILVKGCSRLKLTYQLHYLIEELPDHRLQGMPDQPGTAAVYPGT